MLILFNIEQCAGRFSCKVLHTDMISTKKTLDIPTQKHIHHNILPFLVSSSYDGVEGINTTSLDDTIQKSRARASTLENPLLELHDYYSNSPTSFSYLNEGAVFAKIVLQNIRGQNEMVLDVSFLRNKHSGAQWPLCELPLGKLGDDYWYPSSEHDESTEITRRNCI